MLPNWFSLSVSVVVGVAPLSSPRIFKNLVLFVLLILENYLKSQYNFRLLWIILFPSSVQKEIPPNHWLKLMIVEHKSYSLDIFPATMWLRVCTWRSRKKIVGLYCIKIVRFFLFYFLISINKKRFVIWPTVWLLQHCKSKWQLSNFENGMISLISASVSIGLCVSVGKREKITLKKEGGCAKIKIIYKRRQKNRENEFHDFSHPSLLGT